MKALCPFRITYITPSERLLGWPWMKWAVTRAKLYNHSGNFVVMGVVPSKYHTPAKAENKRP